MSEPNNNKNSQSSNSLNPSTGQTMTKEEEEEFDILMKQRASSRIRTPAFYGIDSSSNNSSSISSISMTSGSSGKSLPSLADTYGNKILSRSSRLKIGYSDTIGKIRPTMEDEISIYGTFRNKEDEDYIGIFDGHGGSDCASYASKHLHKILAEKLEEHKIDGEPKAIPKALTEAFLKINGQITQEKINGGSTALVAFVKNSKCYVANAGDSRAVLGIYDPKKHNKLQQSDTKRISTDHKPDHPVELERIKKSQGYVQIITAKNGKTIARVNGMLAVSRAMGDIFLQPYVTAEPDVHEIDLNDELRQVLIMGCDGVWDVVEDEEAVAIAMGEDDPEVSARKIRDTALNKGSTDNISVAVIHFPSKVVISPPPSPATSTPTTPLLETFLTEEKVDEGPKKRKEEEISDGNQNKVQKVDNSSSKPSPSSSSPKKTTTPVGDNSNTTPIESQIKKPAGNQTFFLNAIAVLVVILAVLGWKYVF